MSYGRRKILREQLFQKEKSADSLLPPLKSETQPEGVTQCERNFAIIKEATHLLLDNPDVVVGQLSHLVSSIVTAGPSVILANLSPLLQDEYLGEFAAVELLIPWNERDSYAQMLHEDKIKAIDIAEKFKVPEKIVLDFLNKSTHDELKKYRETLFDELDEHYAMMQVPSEIEFSKEELEKIFGD